MQNMKKIEEQQKTQDAKKEDSKMMKEFWDTYFNEAQEEVSAITISATLPAIPANAYLVTDISEAQDGSVMAWMCKDDDAHLHVHIAANGKVPADENIMKMFRGCEYLKTADLKGLDTSQVTDMSWMFQACDSLKSLDVSGFDTSQVKYMEGMFFYCKSLKTLDVSRFNTSQAENMYYMFGECGSLETLDVSGFDTSQVWNMDRMFAGCKSLKTVDVSGFDTSRTEDIEDMFSGCEALEKS